MKAKVKCERKVIESLREKGMEGGREWYKFMRGENMSGNVGVESLKVNGHRKESGKQSGSSGKKWVV